ncbi:MAG TPA: metal ABC transporter permease [Verrucomicrobiae bacterium]
MEALREILDPNFLLRNSVYVSLMVGLACPLVGVFLVLRRLVFLGVALPQISSTGVALALSLHVWFGHFGSAHGEEEKISAILGSIIFSLAAIFGLAFMERKGRGSMEGQIGALYVVSLAVSLLLLSKCPSAEKGWLELFKGQIIAVSNGDLWLTGTVMAVVVLVLHLFRREFLLVSFDREMAITLKKNVLLWDVLIYLLIGLTISIAVLTVGPLITFAFLLLPPLIVHPFAKNMKQFAVASSILGGVVAFLGFWLAYVKDLPVGPTDVVLLGGIYLVALVGKKLMSR